MPAIKTTNSNDLTIKNCEFYGFETDIELENVKGCLSGNNQFSKDSDPRLLLKQLSDEILKSNLDESSKRRIAKEIMETLSSREITKEKEGKLVNTLRYVSNKAVDIFIQLATAVASGLIIRG